MLTPFLLHTRYTEQSKNLFGLVERLALTLRLNLHRRYTGCWGAQSNKEFLEQQKPQDTRIN
jgi:hypothetical protein